MLRREKIDRWESLNWFWAGNHEYDPAAKLVFEDHSDREKQDALYVRLGRDGSVASCPGGLDEQKTRCNIERAERLGRLVEQMLEGDDDGTLDFERIAKICSLVFQSSNTIALRRSRKLASVEHGAHRRLRGDDRLDFHGGSGANGQRVSNARI